MKKLLLFVLISSVSFAQNANRNYLSHEFNNGHLKIVVNDGEYHIKLKNDKIAETTFIPKGETYNQTSHAVVLPDDNFTESSVKENTDNLQLSSKGISVTVTLSPFQIQYHYKNKPILSEKNGYFKKDSTDVIDFTISAEELLYGGGARALGMNRRGNRLQLYNRAHYGYETRAELMNFCIPLVLSSKIYAVHFDNAAIGYLDLDSKKTNSLSYETISGRKTYQVIAADSWDELIQNYTDLTGKQPLPPRWVFGNLSSRFGYHSQEEVEKTIKRFEDDAIPVDGIILDLYWFGKEVKGTMGNLDWDKDNFPNPEKMIADLNAKGVKTILITEPFVLTTSSKWQEAVEKKILATDKNGNPFKYDFYFGNTGIIDLFKPDGKEWFWNVYKRLIYQGVGGLWGDLGEPEVFPSAAVTAGGKADEVHNIYGHNWVKLIADGYRNDFPNQRPFILMRSGYSGSQRFGMIPWSGDVSRSWGGLQSQMEIALQMGMQGMAYMHSDLGGFAGDYFDNELYLRWLQYGVFQPIFRPHAQQDVASEVVYKDVDTKAKAKKAVELRYQLLPYNYNLAYENTQFGTPLMRPIFFEEPTNPNALNSASGYFWGKSFLVYPITEKGQKEKEVYFPKSSNWFDFYTGQKHLGGSTEKVKTEELSIPTYVRGGSFIPMYKLAQNTSKINTDELDVHYFNETGISTETSLYSDDGTTPFANNKDLFEMVNFKSVSIKKQLVLSMYVTTASKYNQTSKKINYIIHNITKKPKTILVNNRPPLFEYNETNQTVTFSGNQEGNYLVAVIQF